MVILYWGMRERFLVSGDSDINLRSVGSTVESRFGFTQKQD